MAFKLGKYSFTGPLVSVDKIKDKRGVYAIVCKTDAEYFVIDVDESSKIKTKIKNNEKKDCWKKNCEGQLIYFVYYNVFSKRKRRILIEQEIREIFQLDCKIDKKRIFQEILN